MEKATYPFLHYSIRPGLCIGIAVGTYGQWMGEDWNSVRKQADADLRSRYTTGNGTLPPVLDNAKLRILKLNLKPVAFHSTGPIIDPQPIPIRIPAVFDKESKQQWVAYAPWFMEEACRSPNQKALEKGLLNQVEYITQDWPLSRILRLTRLPDPELTFLEVKQSVKKPQLQKPSRNNEGAESMLRKWGEEEPLTMPWFEPIQAWQREEEIALLKNLLMRPHGGTVVVGERGSGKTLVIRQALQQLQQSLKNKTFPCWRIHSRRLPAGVKYMGEWQGLVEQVVSSIREIRGMLWLDDLAGAIQSGGEHPDSSVAAYFQLFLEERMLPMIMEATPSEWEQVQQKLPGFAQCLQPVHLETLPINKVRLILEAYAQQQNRSQKISIRKPALEEAYRLAHRFLPHENFPGKAIRLLTACLRKAKAEKRKRIERNHLIQEFSNQTGLPSFLLKDEVTIQHDELKTFFEERVVGQPAAVQQLMEVVKVFKTGLNNPHKPITSLLFAGPTGVGKTASAKALATYFFGEQASEKMIRMDMSELQRPDQVDRLIGSTFREGGNHLAGKVREQAFSLVLFDEIEKANPLVFDTLLNILDEGLLLDSFGRLTHFRNSIIIMTTNLGADAPAAIGFGPENNIDRYKKALQGTFRPEFINRIDGFVFFRKLSQDNLLQITRRELDQLSAREGLKSRDLKLQFEEPLIAYLAKEGWDERYGARPLQRMMERYLVTPLSEWLLTKPDLQSQEIEVGLEKGQKITFTPL